MLKTLSSLAAAAWMLALLAAPLDGAAAEAADEFQTPVTLRSSTLVDGEIVRLGDIFNGIADPDLAGTPVARAPEPGIVVEIGTRWLVAVAKAHSLDWRPRSRYERTSLRRSSQDIETEEIQEALRVALSDQGLQGDVQLVLDNPGLRLRLPGSSERSLRVTRLTLDPSSGRFMALVVAPASGDPVATLSLTGRALELAEVPVLSRNLKPGDVVQARDIDWISVPTNRLTRTTVLDAASLIGMSPRRPVRAQNLVRTTDLQTPVVVGKNSLVTIRLETARMQLTVQGRALEDGAAGDVVRVMNTKSNSVVNAIVVDTGSVVVVPAAIAAER